MNNSDFYFNVIDGNQKLDPSILKGISDQDETNSILEFAFEAIVEIGGEHCVNKILNYIDTHINQYSIKKNLALMNIGYIGDKDTEKILLPYLESKNCDLQFSAFCSVCELARRKMLSKETLDIIINMFTRKLNEKSFSNEEVIEVIITINNLSFDKKANLIEIASSNYPDAIEESRQFLN